MMTTWILGSFFFIFILCAIVYVLTINVREPDIAHQSRAEALSASVSGRVAEGEKYPVSTGYQVIFSPRVFVDYPFGIRVVFAKPDLSGPIMPKPAERTGHGNSNVHRRLRPDEYNGWPQAPLQDPELTVIGGRIEFESDEPDPGIRVELRPPGESFRPIKTVEEHVLRQAEETVFSLWLHPLEPTISSLAVVVSVVEGTAQATTPGTDGRNFHELATIELTVPVTSFPIVLR